jgi:DHA3 family tetracycline resistance protein-like MFS transporter
MRRLRILHPLRERDFALFETGSTVSLIGDGLFMVAIAWQVYDIWNVPTALAVVGVAETVPLVALLLFSGVLIDRVERRWVMFWACLVRGACVGLIGLLAVSGVLALWHVFVIAVFYGAGRAFEGPASGAMVPDLVPTHLLVQANSLNGVVRPLAQLLVGPALGGLIVHELGAGTAFLLDAATFGFAALMLTLLRPRLAAIQREEQPSVREDIREGLRFVRKHTWLWGTIVWALFAAMLAYGPFVVLVPYIVKNELGGNAGELGLVFAAGGLGAVISSLVVGQTGLPKRHMTWMYWLWVVGFFDMFLYTVVQLPWHAMLIAFYAEACWGLGMVIWVTLMQRVVPSDLLGRVKSVDWLVSSGFTPISFAVVGPLAAWLGAEPVLAGAGIGGALLTAAFYFLPGMRNTETPSHREYVDLSGRQPEPLPAEPTPVEVGL